MLQKWAAIDIGAVTSDDPDNGGNALLLCLGLHGYFNRFVVFFEATVSFQTQTNLRARSAKFTRTGHSKSISGSTIQTGDREEGKYAHVYESSRRGYPSASCETLGCPCCSCMRV